MKPFADVHWDSLPGNHDPHRPQGVWDRVAQLGLPPNVQLAPTPFALGDDARARQQRACEQGRGL